MTPSQRAQVADLLSLENGDISNLEVARRLHVSRNTVQRVRADLDLPSFRRGPRSPYDSVAEIVLAKTVRVGEHYVWKGPVQRPFMTPVVTHKGATYTVARVAFETHHGRAPQGYVRVSCERPHCIRGEHLADAKMRRDPAS